MTSPSDSLSRPGFLGLSLVALATLMYEVLLTRIFSVTMWYHFAFVAVSVALFGMTVGAVLVYLFPRRFSPDHSRGNLAVWALLFSVTTLASFLLHLRIRFLTVFSPAGIATLAITYLVIAVPFVCSGVCVCVALTQFPRQVSRLYAADLVGAAVGCILLILALELMDGPTAVVLVSLLAALSSVAFAAEARRPALRRLTLAWIVLVLALGAVNFYLASTYRAPIRLSWVKGEVESAPLYEKWSSYSRVRVTDPAWLGDKPSGWGMSPTLPDTFRAHQYLLNIDASAGTLLTRFDGDLAKLAFLRYDITNLVHYLRPDSSILVIGSGGGRDVLSALQFGQKAVTAVEINHVIFRAVNQHFGDFTGHLDRLSNVRFVNDEARSFIARSADRFDIVQISLIDTWAATAAGAFVLSENSLYTTEAWRIFIDHLSDRGVLSVSRWYHARNPAEAYRLTALAAEALRQSGVSDPRRHLILVANKAHDPAPGEPDGVATLLLSRIPFTDADLDHLDHVAADMSFPILLSPRSAPDPTLADLTSPRAEQVIAGFPMNIAPPTDNQPFFFNMARPRDLFSRQAIGITVADFNLKAVYMLAGLLVFVVILTAGFIVVPVWLRADKAVLVRHASLSAFFIAIGLAFMLVEISQMQRLIVLLGHPTYSLSVVLFSLLVSSGIGSFTTQRLDWHADRGAVRLRLVLLVAMVAVVGLMTPWVIRSSQPHATAIRIAASLALLLPLGLFMGMAFPLGMKAAAATRADIAPWLWGINGATSVCASVLAVVIAMTWGISTAYWTGAACYLLAFLSLATQRHPAPIPALQTT